jgi:MoaA/NifB/PqqE/SkfB family radical SAM enzyme
MGLSRTVRLTERFQAAGQYVHNRLTGRPTSLTLEITKRCNATCDFCPYWEADEVDEVKDWTPAIRYFQPLHVSITGGEPFLRKDLVDIVRQVKGVPGFRYIGLYTNGWLLNEKRVKELTEAGVNQIQISLNYPDERQDTERGIPGLWKKLATFLPEMAAKGYDNIAVGTFICAENIDCLVDLAKVVASWKIKHSFNAYSRLKNDNTSHVLTPEQIARARQALDSVIEIKHRNRNSLTSDQYLRTIPTFFEEGQRPGCTAGDKFLYITQEGWVKQCPEMPPIAHIADLEKEGTRTQPVSCGLCWYACRGEHQTKINFQRLHELAVT